MSLPVEKGDRLEQAVREIEAAILRSSATLRENTFKITSKKVVIVGGVRHEIDIYVEVDIGPGYSPIFIFECKNWESAVGKNEIIIFSEKIAAVGAQKGFFVAKSFSKDAMAQAEKDPRVQTLIATEHGVVDAYFFHSIVREREKTDANLEMTERGASSSKPRISIDVATAIAFLKGERIDLLKFANDWIDQLANENLNCFNSLMLPEGDYERSAEAEKKFEPGDFIVNDHDMASARLSISFSVRVLRPPIVSHFEVATRGRRISFAPIQVGDGAIQASFIFTKQL